MIEQKRSFRILAERVNHLLNSINFSAKEKKIFDLYPQYWTFTREVFCQYPKGEFEIASPFDWSEADLPVEIATFFAKEMASLGGVAKLLIRAENSYYPDTGISTIGLGIRKNDDKDDSRWVELEVTVNVRNKGRVHIGERERKGSLKAVMDLNKVISPLVKKEKGKIELAGKILKFARNQINKVVNPA